MRRGGSSYEESAKAIPGIITLRHPPSPPRRSPKIFLRCGGACARALAGCVMIARAREAYIYTTMCCVCGCIDCAAVFN